MVFLYNWHSGNDHFLDLSDHICDLHIGVRIVLGRQNCHCDFLLFLRQNFGNIRAGIERLSIGVCHIAAGI